MSLNAPMFVYNSTLDRWSCWSGDEFLGDVNNENAVAYLDSAVSLFSHRTRALSEKIDQTFWKNLNVDCSTPLEEFHPGSLDGFCPFWTGKSIHETQDLVLIPNCSQTLIEEARMLEKMINQKLPGKSFSIEISDEAMDPLTRNNPETSYWSLITKKPIPQANLKSPSSQRALFERGGALREEYGYDQITTREALYYLAAKYVRSQEESFPLRQDEFIRCKEQTNKNYPIGIELREGNKLQIFVDHFDSDFYDIMRNGVLAIKRI